MMRNILIENLKNACLEKFILDVTMCLIHINNLKKCLTKPILYDKASFCEEILNSLQCTLHKGCIEFKCAV